jgi:hypothetical protein
MKKYKYIFGILFALACAHPHEAQAVTCSVPYNATNGISQGQPAQASQINSNFSSLVYCANNLDATNFTSGGIYASQIVPTNASQATFGGAQGYTFAAPATTTVPLTIKGQSGQTADLLDLNIASGSPVVSVLPNGIVNGLMFHAGTDGQQTIAGALVYGVDQGGYTKAIIASNDGTSSGGVTANAYGLFASTGVGSPTTLQAIDVSGNVYHAGSMTVGGNYNTTGSYNGAVALMGGATLPYDALATGARAGLGSTHIDHNPVQVTVNNGSSSNCVNITWTNPFTVTPDVSVTSIDPRLWGSVSSRSTTGAQVCASRPAAESTFTDTVSLEIIAIGE